MTEKPPSLVSPAAPVESVRPQKTYGTGMKVSLINLGLLVLIGAGLYLWKERAVRKVLNESVRREEAVEAKAQLELSKRTEGFLQLTAIPFVWAIRSEMLRQNMEQVDGYTRSFVQQPGVGFVAVANAAGKIIVATDKKWEKQPITGLIAQEAVAVSYVQVLKGASEDSYQVVAPVMGYNSRMGTVLLSFSAGDVQVQSRAGELDPRVTDKKQ